ncbi:MAG: response regulator [Desulfobacterales bacterium]
MNKKFSRFLTLTLLGFIGLSLTLVVGSLYGLLSTTMVKEFSNELKVVQSEVCMALQERFNLLETRVKEASLNNAIRVNLMLGVRSQLSELLKTHRPFIRGAYFFIQEKGDSQFIPEIPDSYKASIPSLTQISRMSDFQNIKFQNYGDGICTSLISCPILRKDERLGTIYAIYDLSLDTQFWKRFKNNMNERLLIQSKGDLVDLHTSQSVRPPSKIRSLFINGFESPKVDLFQNCSFVGLKEFPDLFYAISSKSLHNKKHALFIKLTGLCTIIFLLTLIVSFQLIKKITEPLESMAEQALKISQKPSSFFLHEKEIRYVEFQKLAQGFNQVLRSLLEAQEELKRQTQKKLDASEELYRRTLEAAPDSITISRLKDGCFQQVNQAFSKMTGYSLGEALGKTSFDLNLYNNPLDREHLIKEIHEKGEVNGLEIQFRKKDGTVLDTLLSVRTIQFGEEECMIAVASDITELKRAQEEKKKLETQLQHAQKMEAIGTLAGGVAHDFNNLLGIITGNVELALDTVLESNPARFNLDEIRTASWRARDVVRQLLSFARKTAFERKPIKIIPIIRESIQLLRATIPTNIEIRQHITNANDTVLADQTQIQQVLINLITNAYHALVETGGIIEIGIQEIVLKANSFSSTFDLIPGKYLKIAVSDTGQGIAPNVIDRIFDPYFTTKGVGKGSGMGLSVVHGIIKSHNGAISVKSKIGEGTTFIILLPVIEKEAVEHAEPVKMFPTGSENILFVDDEEAMTHVGRNRLEGLGYHVETRTNPVEALELFHRNHDQFDLVITDMTMPQMTGDRLVKEILKIRPDMPTILCTGFSENIDEEKAKEIGVCQYIEKPFNRSVLASTVRKALDES